MDLHLSQVSIKALEEAFRVFDSENAGYVSSKVFKDVVEGAGLDDHTKVFDPFIQMADQPIKMNQFIKIISNQVLGCNNEEYYKNMFLRLDRDGSGGITSEDLKAVADELGEVIDVRECREMIKLMDVDGSGMVRLDQLKGMF